MMDGVQLAREGSADTLFCFGKKGDAGDSSVRRGLARTLFPSHPCLSAKTSNTDPLSRRRSNVRLQFELSLSMKGLGPSHPRDGAGVPSVMP